MYSILSDNNWNYTVSYTPVHMGLPQGGKDDVSIPMVYLYRKEYDQLKLAMDNVQGVCVYIGLSQHNSSSGT